MNALRGRFTPFGSFVILVAAAAVGELRTPHRVAAAIHGREPEVQPTVALEFNHLAFDKVLRTVVDLHGVIGRPALVPVIEGIIAFLIRGALLDRAVDRVDQLQLITCKAGVIVCTVDAAKSAGDLLEDVQVLELVFKEFRRDTRFIGVLEPVCLAVGQGQVPVIAVPVN